jgi:hypothetical protein
MKKSLIPALAVSMLVIACERSDRWRKPVHGYVLHRYLDGHLVDSATSQQPCDPHTDHEHDE